VTGVSILYSERVLFIFSQRNPKNVTHALVVLKDLYGLKAGSRGGWALNPPDVEEGVEIGAEEQLPKGPYRVRSL
jgi:hypothetical protein